MHALIIHHHTCIKPILNNRKGANNLVYEIVFTTQIFMIFCIHTHKIFRFTDRFTNF